MHFLGEGGLLLCGSLEVRDRRLLLGDILLRLVVARAEVKLIGRVEDVVLLLLRFEFALDGLHHRVRLNHRTKLDIASSSGRALDFTRLQDLVVQLDFILQILLAPVQESDALLFVFVDSYLVAFGLKCPRLLVLDHGLSEGELLEGLLGAEGRAFRIQAGVHGPALSIYCERLRHGRLLCQFGALITSFDCLRLRQL